jgi:HEAT repeat protein
VSVVDDPAMEPAGSGRGTSSSQRRRRVVEAGHRGDADSVAAARSDPDASVRAARLGALERLGTLSVADLAEAFEDADPAVRRRASVLGARLGGRGSRSTLPALLATLLADPDPLVAEAAAWALGERRHRASVETLGAMATGHADPRCREAAVAALGAIGDPLGLSAVLTALGDRPPVRRRAVVALAGFASPEVEHALTGCLGDPDWQVRQAAEILLGR